jgi:hypothetical protein
VQFFQGVTVSANGTELTSFNRSAKSTNLADMKIYVAPTVTDPGTALGEVIVPATAVGAIHSGSEVQIEFPAEFDTSKKMLIRMTNENGAGARVAMSLSWLEL